MPWEICELFLTAQPPLLPPMNFYPPGPTFSSTMVGFNPGSVPTLVPTLSLPAVTLDGKSMDVMAPSYQHTDPVTKAVLDNIMGKLPTKKIPVICRCDVCNLEFSGQVVLDTHLAGAKHAKKLLTKQRNKLDICLKGDLRLNLTNIKPDIQALTEIHQAQGSH
uniref:C2H2-type domain-containing protein n=1 Tax=Timema cristinae TaxID=61476 RepID=A0A7R9GQF8_TIMCR|nr:unnamed protein product [Timema cristinae]